MDGYILLPLGAGAPGPAKIEVAQQQARALEATTLLLHVLPPAALQPAAVSPVEATARASLDAVAMQFRAVGLRAQTLIRTGSPAGVIVDAAREFQARLIILGRSVRGRIPRALLGSTADAVIRDARCPVLLVRAPVAASTANHPLLALDPPDLLVPRELGLRRVELSRIVGSATRLHELGSSFRLLHPSPADEARFQGVLQATAQGEDLPPVELYKYGFGYYVRDGHHRVAAALALGRNDILARVTELAPMRADEDEVVAARRTFEERTGLDSVGATKPSSYEQLLRAVEQYRRDQAIDALAEAARQWYTTVYRPLRQQIRAKGTAALAPDERPGDVIARALAWRDSEAARRGTAPTWQEALAAAAVPEGIRGAAEAR